jgi:hypothetical protein
MIQEPKLGRRRVDPTSGMSPAGGDDTTDPSRSSPRTRGDRRRWTSATLVVAVFGAAVLGGAAGALTTTSFTDVASTHPFKADIDWAVANGIAHGYADDTFKPNSAVTRAQMTAFVHRHNESFEVVPVVVNPGTSSTWTVTATCPPGKVAVAGGGHVYETEIMMTDSYPVAGTAWRVIWESDDSTPRDPSRLDVWALCMPA